MSVFASLKSAALRLAKALVCHRAIYIGLAICHGSACVMTSHPEVYAPIAGLYLVLAVTG
jgi:hypothetical protein